MKISRSIILIVVLVVSVLGLTFTRQAAAAATPTVDIVSVVKDTSVTVKTNNFPAHTQFDVRMGKFGTMGVNGIKVTTIDSGNGGSFTQTFNIPAELKGEANIAIRLESASGYFAYDWFANNPLAATTTPAAATATPKATTTTAAGTTGTPKPTVVVPTISIVGAVKDTSVTVQTANYPKNTKFDVRMGKIGTRGIDGTRVATIDSGNGGTFTSTFTIPADLKGESLIAIRLESSTGYFSFNWFQNTTFGTSGTPVPTTVPEATKTPGPTTTANPTQKPGTTTTPAPTSTIVPTITITAVVKDQSVSIKTANFPKNTKFDVLMGKMWTAGVNGIKVTTVDTGDTGSITATFNIPAELKGQDRISIRLVSSSGYFSFNWFWNN